MDRLGALAERERGEGTGEMTRPACDRCSARSVVPVRGGAQRPCGTPTGQSDEELVDQQPIIEQHRSRRSHRLLVGEVGIEGETFHADEFAYLGCERHELQLTLGEGTRLLLLGGEPFAEPVLMWWNFVGWSKASIARAQADWEQGEQGEARNPRFGPVGDGQAPRLIPPPLPWRVSE